MMISTVGVKVIYILRDSDYEPLNVLMGTWYKRYRYVHAMGTWDGLQMSITSHKNVKILCPICSSL